jgi:hypothetical protein
LDDHEVTIAADIAALRKTGGRNSVRYSLIQEIQPVTVGNPCCYRLSKRGEKMMGELDYRMQVYALPLDDEPDDDGVPDTFVFDDEDDEMLHRWEASRNVVRG